LITYFQDRTKDSDWVEKVKLFPDTPVWKLWKARTLQGDLTGAKELWDTCRNEIRRQEQRNLQDEERRVRRADERARVVVEDAEHEKVEARAALTALEAAANAHYQTKRDARIRLRLAEDVFNALESAKIEKENAQNELDSLSGGPNTLATRRAIAEARERLLNAADAFDQLVNPHNDNQQEDQQDQQGQQNEQDEQDRQVQQNEGNHNH
jgi:hypothetical protein